MNTTSICVINGAQIQVSSDEAQLVPIKPICQALGVAYAGQVNQIKNHPIFGSVVSLSNTTGADGKTYEMLCLPLEFVFGWIFSINPNNVNEAVRENMIKYQIECNHALYSYFAGRHKKIIEQNKQEIALLEEIASLTQESQAIKQQLADKKRMLAQLREDRISPQPSLF